MAGEASIYRMGARVRGFLCFGVVRSLSDGPERRGVRFDLVGCEERAWAEGREEKCSPAAVSETETSDEGTDNGTAKFDGWAIKQGPNVTKLDRQSIYTIIRSHANFHPIPRTFLCHL